MSALAASALSSERRLAANRANAQLSTGPTSPEGKAKSSLNAVKTGLTGRTVLLPSEDAEAYETHLLQYLEAFQPVGEREIQLVQHLADTQWRLQRIPSLEAGFFALGRRRYAELFEDEADEAIRTVLLDAHILQTDVKHFKNLHLQEARLRRQYQQDAKELKELQAERHKEQEAEKTKDQPSVQVNGFEFATSPTTNPNPQPSSECKRAIVSDATNQMEQTHLVAQTSTAIPAKMR